MQIRCLGFVIAIALLCGHASAAPSAAAANTLSDGLIGLYSFDSRNLADSSGQGNNGTAVGPDKLSFVPGIAPPSGYAVHFDGKSSISLPQAAFAQVSTLSVAFWFNPAASQAALYTNLIYRANQPPVFNGFPDRIYSIWWISDGGISVTYTPAGASTQYDCVDRSYNIAAGSWNHVAVTIDGPNKLVHVYLNGADIADCPLAAGQLAPGALALDLGKNLDIGLGGAGNFNGSLDAVRFYDRVLTPAEVQALYAQAESSPEIVYSFTGSATAPGADGAFPAARLSPDSEGRLYGATTGGGIHSCKAGSASTVTCGTLFTLIPPSSGQEWIEKPLFAFSQKAWAPQGRIVIQDGQIYGTTLYGGAGCAPTGCGTAYAWMPGTILAPDRITYLHTFISPADGLYPNPRLIPDKSGGFYGSTTQGGLANAGVIFRLTPPVPPATGWGYTLIYRFAGGSDGKTPNDFTIGSDGAIYGTTAAGGAHGLGVAYRLTPPASATGRWTYAKLYDFQGGGDGASPSGGGVIADAKGNLFGTTSQGGGAGCPTAGCGTVFELSPGTNGWTETVLYAFQGQNDGAHPEASLIGSTDGTKLYGTTGAGGGAGACGAAGCGTVFQLTAPASGSGPWTETVLRAFVGAPDGSTPLAGLDTDSTGALYGTTSAGGATGAGAAFKIVP